MHTLRALGAQDILVRQRCGNDRFAWRSCFPPRRRNIGTSASASGRRALSRRIAPRHVRAREHPCRPQRRGHVWRASASTCASWRASRRCRNHRSIVGRHDHRETRRGLSLHLTSCASLFAHKVPQPKDADINDEDASRNAKKETKHRILPTILRNRPLRRAMNSLASSLRLR